MTVDQARAIERDPTTTSRALLVLALSEFRRELDRLEAAELERQRTAALLVGLADQLAWAAKNSPHYAGLEMAANHVAAELLALATPSTDTTPGGDR